MTFPLSVEAEKAFPRDWYVSLAKWSLMVLAAQLALEGALAFFGRCISFAREYGRQKVRNSPGVEPKIMSFFLRMMVLMGALNAGHLI